VEQSYEEDQLNDHICEIIQVLGSKWAFAVIAELNKSTKRFNQLERDIGIIRTQSLTNTLRHLEKSGFVHREVFNTVPVTVEYSLTDKGMDFQSVLTEMNKWAVKWSEI